MSSPSIFVDDNDPNIKYGNGWVLQTFSAANRTGLVPSPVYGTLHVFELENTSANISYTFNGTYISAVFGPNTDPAGIIGCTINGQPQSIINNTLNSLGSSVLCITNQTLQDGVHELLIEVNRTSINSISFDYLEYSPSEGLPLTGDLFYINGFDNDFIKVTPEFGSTGVVPGGSLDFDFIGYSLGLYGLFWFEEGTPQSPSAASYSIDGQAPVNFTITNPTTVANRIIAPQILIQTPRYPLGQHHFHLDFFGTNDTVPFPLYSIIVQNHTLSVDLEPIPAVSTTITPASTASVISAEPSSKAGRTNLLIIGLAVGVAITIALFVIIRVLFNCRRRNRILLYEQAHSTTIVPFVQPRLHDNEYVKGITVVEDTERVARPDSPHRSLAQNSKSVTITRRLFIALRGLFNRHQKNDVLIHGQQTHPTIVYPFIQPRLHQNEFVKRGRRTEATESMVIRPNSGDGSTTVVSGRNSQRASGNGVPNEGDQ